MDYKKIIAASAVTSAAFVVPVVVDAADVNDLITVSDIQLGQVLTAPETYSTGATAEKITKYEWFAVYTDGTETPISKTKTVTVPVNPNLKEIILKFTAGATEYQQKITIAPVNTITFEKFPRENDTPQPVSTGLVNQSIQAKLPSDSKIIQYQWYIIDGNTSQLVSGEEDQVIDIPVAASGKTLLVVATDEDPAKKYYGTLEITALQLDEIKREETVAFNLNGKAITEKTKSIAPGDMVSVENLILKAHSGAIEILPAQALVTYQWYYQEKNTNSGVYSLIPGATSPSYLVSNDAFGRNLKNISVAINIEVPESNTQHQQYLYVIELTNEEALQLEDEISGNLGIIDPTNPTIVKGKLKEPLSKYEYTQKFDDFVKDMGNIKGTYDNLSTGSKSLVPSYSKVTQALQDIKTVQALMNELEEFTEAKSAFERDPSELSHAKLVKQFETIEKKYLKFDSLKRSLLEMDTPYKNNYIEVMAQHLKNLTQDAGDAAYQKSSLELIADINSRIEGLFDVNDDNVRVYTFENLDEDVVPQTRAGMTQYIKLLEAEIKQVDRKQQPVINASLLKTAKADLKKADAVAEKIAAIAKSTLDKKIKATLAARTAFDKLSFMQQSLITADEYDIIYGDDAYSEENAIKAVTEAIDTLVNGMSYVFNGYTGDLIGDAQSLGGAIDILLAQYKTLSAKAKKSVTNYAVLTQAKKDLAAANKVVKAIESAYDFDRSTPPAEADKKKKSIQSKYRAAYNAYVKLTPLQRSIVEELTEDNVTLADLAEEVEDLTNDVFTPAPESELAYDPSGVVGSLADLEVLISGGARSVQEVEDKIKEITTAYKELNSAEKKGVYNYSILARAKTVAKKAASVQTTLTSALNSGSETRMISAVNAYNKLTDAQKQMISEVYDAVDTALQTTEKQELQDDLRDFDLQSFTLEDIENIQKNLALVNKKEYQTYPGYQNYLQALKIQKAVDSFLKKFNKLDPEPTYSKKQSIVKDFKKLTTQQLSYLKDSYEDDTSTDKNENIYEVLTTWEAQLNDTAITLNDEIGKLIIVDEMDYQYAVDQDKNILTNLEKAIADIKKQYKALDAKERKLVTHYSFLSNIERDIKAVRKALDVQAAGNVQTTQQTYNRLTRQQQSLYDIIEPPAASTTP